MAVILPILIVLASILIIHYNWKRRHIYKLAASLPGPSGLPIVGIGLSFLGRQEDILKVYTGFSSKYKKPMKFWLGPILLVYFTYAEHIEKILSSSKLAHKHDIYELLKIYLGDGLVSNSGEKYKKHRRLIQPLINLKFVTGNTEIFQRHVDIYLDRLESQVGKGTFDIHDFTHHCLADIIGDIVLGIQIDSQKGKNMNYLKATADMYYLGFARVTRPWLYPNFIYSLTKAQKDQDRITNTTTSFIKQATEQAWKRIKIKKMHNQDHVDPTAPIIDQIANIIDADPSTFNDTDFLYHMYTLYLASEDTMTVITSVLCVCLGMYPEYQKLAAEEIRSVFGESPREIRYEDLAKLQYLEMCIRDVLRLIPIAPIIIRKATEDFHIDNIVIPKDCGIAVSIYEVHRDPKHWENPCHFHPDHFLPQVVAKRHPFAYVPFSAGPRSCVGKVLAFYGLKLIMANILQRFELEADGKFPDIVICSDITVRSQNGYKVRLKKRVWT